MNRNDRFIIVGAGAFGLSTALRLAQDGYTSVTVVDRCMPPVPDGSSNDISRVIRFDYGDPVYAQIAKEAYDQWKTPEYSEAFHQTPCLWVSQEGTLEQPVQPRAAEYSRKTRQVLTEMGQEWHAVPSVEEAKRRFPALSGKLATPGFDGFYNTNAGWADAGLAVQRLASRCVAAGVSFISGPNGHVVELEYGRDGVVDAVRTINGNRITGDRFIVATGAWTASLIPSWNSMMATGQVVGWLRLTPEEMIRLKDLPIYFNFSTGFFCFPVHEATGYLKVAVHGFGYTSPHQKAVSAPPSSAVSARANFIPADGMQRLLAGLRDILPELAERGFEKVGLCWYNDTPTGDFIFDYHPEHKNLFIATGGSGHAFKFLPVLGKYIVGSLERKLPSELLEKWKFPTEFRERFQGDAFQGDGSRGGPERREMTPQEREVYTAAMTALVRRSKI
ncbi:L-pipecolate oxidase [Aspergillus udagawae]|uniref:L-pipecolate oxidase n=1 Tax=Aspergillus udagawae TaxID=91492 RepID=A0ABQ1AV76_9EURO|nr:L-pipecolate oxidase [Aspergillus udagawae]GFF34251.1 L-pipecolate oxidase [Aspergillus udagawae]GFF88649.1 L-pipecolate oxidase [Aspergillus udagawae]GFG17647.1 L-pipecolate oxidase [Aspergillus udagawae]